MESFESQEREDGIRLRKKVEDNKEEVESSEDDMKTDIVKRIIESTKELTDCMPTDLPSAKRMVSNYHSLVMESVVRTSFLYFTYSWKMDYMPLQSLAQTWLLELVPWLNKLEIFVAR